MTFNLSTKQRAKLLYYREKFKNEVNALDNKSRPVNFRVHIGEYYFMSVKDDWDYVRIFQHLPHPLKCYASFFYLLYPNREGISISFNEWRWLLEFIPTIHEEYPELAKELLTHKWGA